jgi:hypothetical protein
VNPDRICRNRPVAGTAPVLTGYQKDIYIQRFAGILANERAIPFFRAS